MPERLTVRKTYKLYVNGEFARSESGRSFQPSPEVNVPRASRKDLRDAIKAARGAFASWSGRTAFNRGQILYRAAEMFDGRRQQFVAELGGKGNIRKMQGAFDQAVLELTGAAKGSINPWYYPSVSEYATLLEKNDFEVRFITLFDRPTPLADDGAGMRNWIAMFGSDYIAKLGPELRESFVQRVEELLRPELFRDGQWCADYRRLRFSATK